MSIVMHHRIDAPPIKKYLNNNPNKDILILKGAIENQCFLEEVFSKDSHYLKSGRSIYQELVFKYEVVEVIHSKQFENGDFIWELRQPNYSRNAVKKNHISGILGSPILLITKPNYPVVGDTCIVQLNKLNQSSSEFPSVFSFVFKEGVSAKTEILKCLKSMNTDL